MKQWQEQQVPKGMGRKGPAFTWRSLPMGGTVTEAGNSINYETGDWRTLRPVVDMQKCTHCMICWVFCPDGAIQVQEARFTGFSLDHCKGCGICAQECPPKAIEMVDEASLQK